MLSIFAFFILICVLVFVHEYGHFWAARKCGVKVLRFSIGFGKVLWRKKDKQGTEFAFSLIPLGGYVQMHNGEAEHQLPD
ncbi:site-2 protease family protein, partial [Glaesserella parasuis]|nr:site-2 protease family protein [Glaesserella parasuis]